MTPATLPPPDRSPSVPGPQPDVSIVIISYNTCNLLRECLRSVLVEAGTLQAEVLVVDNGSGDGSAEMVEAEFPEVRLFRSQVNLGFGAANNLALQHAIGRYFVLLNSDAFLAPGALALAIRHMEETPTCALGGGRLIGQDGSAQPSARCFHSLLSDTFVLTGLAARYPKSRLFGRFDRTWADPMQASEVDWVPGAFSILRPDALGSVGLFDPAFFLYYEEVDLCRRFKKAGLQIWYWPDIVVTHIGGEAPVSLPLLSSPRRPRRWYFGACAAHCFITANTTAAGFTWPALWSERFTASPCYATASVSMPADGSARGAAMPCWSS